MAQRSQSYKSHRRYIPVYHFFALPVVILNVVVEIARLTRSPTLYQAWLVLLALALAIFIVVARSMAARVQDRVIRLEERMRLGRLLPEELRGRIDELRPSHLVALRFASDEELPDLARRCLTGELTRAEQIKKEIRTWRPDYLRM
ncbi:MAG TPA: DUF6526 family protein [Rhodothermia bacterium]|nr:DUF6526 family protein [Rhodothermia bacterium]